MMGANPPKWLESEATKKKEFKSSYLQSLLILNVLKVRSRLIFKDSAKKYLGNVLAVKAHAFFFFKLIIMPSWEKER